MSDSDFFPFQTGRDSCSDGFLGMLISRFNLNISKAWNDRQIAIHIYQLVYSGRLYDNLKPWFSEYSGNKYIPLNKRRPCINYPIPKIIVNESVGMLFGDNHFPTVRCEDLKTEEFLQSVERLSNIKSAMILAAKCGSVGSACVIIKVLDAKFYIDVLDTLNLFPVFDRFNPSRLKELTERVPIRGFELLYAGHKIENEEKNKNKLFWLVRKWTLTEEIYFLPEIAEEGWEDRLTIDKERSTVHGFGFLPAVWIKNMPTFSNLIDGECTFSAAIDLCIESDYQMSQLSRLLRYSSDPTMVIKDSSMMEGEQLVKGSGVLNLAEDGEAYLLEMNGKSSSAVLEFVRVIRQFAMESVRGNRANPEKISALNSGKALQMLNEPLISLASELRTTYGDGGLLEIYKIMLNICKVSTMEISDVYGEVGNIDESINTITLDWPSWYQDTPLDTLQEAQALSASIQGKFLSKETAVKSIAEKYNVSDVKKELTLIDGDGIDSEGSGNEVGTEFPEDVDHPQEAEK